MYEMFKILQAAVEQIGKIADVSVSTDNAYFGNRITLSGITADGSEFKLELTIKTKETDHE